METTERLRACRAGVSPPLDCSLGGPLDGEPNLGDTEAPQNASLSLITCLVESSTRTVFRAPS